MLSKNQHKLITTLKQKKYRQKNQLFIVEGPKVVDEFLNSSFELVQLFCTENYAIANALPFTRISEKELKQISSLKSPNHVLALFKMAKEKSIVEDDLIIVLDGVNDPGNLGTIIRLCDWFGIKHLVCSTDTVDCYNQKVVQASMGSLTRVGLHYQDLSLFLKHTTLPIYAAMMDGENVNKTALTNPAILVMGNEANGIQETIQELIHHQISIPRFKKDSSVESLNVATATAILLNSWRS